MKKTVIAVATMATMFPGMGLMATTVSSSDMNNIKKASVMETQEVSVFKVDTMASADTKLGDEVCFYLENAVPAEVVS